jgi:hypothetical protein
MLRQVHGHPQLHLPQAEDVWPSQDYHSECFLHGRLHLIAGQLGACRVAGSD